MEVLYLFIYDSWVCNICTNRSLAVHGDHSAPNRGGATSIVCLRNPPNRRYWLRKGQCVVLSNKVELSALRHRLWGKMISHAWSISVCIGVWVWLCLCVLFEMHSVGGYKTKGFFSCCFFCCQVLFLLVLFFQILVFLFIPCLSPV